jgi:hypothetical protein
VGVKKSEEDILRVKNGVITEATMFPENVGRNLATRASPLRWNLDTVHIENQIDELVFELYEFTKE